MGNIHNEEFITSGNLDTVTQRLYHKKKTPQRFFFGGGVGELFENRLKEKRLVNK